MSGDEPRFDRPPVAEVTLSVQFETLDHLHAVHVGQLWNEWATQYPHHEEHDELAPVPEESEVVPAEPSIVFKISDSTPLPRTWFLDDSREHVVQVQRDRFILNWRRRDNHDYPHYAELLPRFRTEFEQFETFIVRHGIGRLQANQCQITYLNPVPRSGDLGCPEGLPGLLEGWSGATSETPSLEGGEASVRIRFPLRDESGNLQGRLHVNAGSATNSETDEPVLLVELTARGRPLGEGLDGIVRFFDVGHHAIVTMFAALTTKSMHTIWGRRL